MKIQFHIRGLKDNAEIRHRLQLTIARLEERVSISAAAVVVERELNKAPAFRAFALLAVPGPDLHAEARDHTLEAAWLKVGAALRRQIERRRGRQGSVQRRHNRVRVPRVRHASGAVSR